MHIITKLTYNKSEGLPFSPSGAESDSSSYAFIASHISIKALDFLQKVC